MLLKFRVVFINIGLKRKMRTRFLLSKQKPFRRDIIPQSRIFDFIEIVKRKAVVEAWITLCKRCPNTEFFLIRISHIQSKYGKIRTRKNSIFGHFLHSVSMPNCEVYFPFFSEILKVFLDYGLMQCTMRSLVLKHMHF